MSETEYRRNPNDSTKVRVANVLRESGLSSKIAFVDGIYDDVRTNGGSRFLDDQVILASARKLKVPKDEELFEGVFQGFEERDTPANRSLLLLETPPPINAANLSKTLHAILRAGDPGQQLTVTPQEYAKQQRANNRRMWINTITGNGQFKNYPLYAANYGGLKWIQADTLEKESDEMLEALSQRVPEWREQNTGGRPQREKLPDGVTATQHARERELESDEFLAHPEHPEREYTMKEAKANLRELMFYPGSNQGRGPRRVAAINRLLSGRSFGE